MIKRVSFFSVFSEFILISIIIYAPIFNWSYRVFPRSILELSSFLLLFLFFVRVTSVAKSKIVYPPSMLFMLSFFAVILFQLIPLSKNILNTLSPNTLQLYQQYLPFVSQKSSFTLSLYRFATKEAVMLIFASFGLFFTTMNLIDKKSKAERLIVIIILWATILSFYGIMEKFFISGGGETYFFGTLGSRNVYAGYMIMMAPLAIGYALSCRDIYKRIFFGFLGAVISVSIFLSNSRGGSLSLIFALLLLSMFSLRRFSIKGNRLVITTIVIIIIVLSIIAGLGVLVERMTHLRHGFISRWNVLKDSLSIVRDFPLFGVGLGNFQYIYPKYKSPYDSGYYVHLHNDHFQLLVEGGFIAFIFCLLFFILIFKDILIRLRKTDDPFVGNIVIGGLCGLFAVILHASFDFNFHIPAILFMFWLILGLIYKFAHIDVGYDSERN